MNENQLRISFWRLLAATVMVLTVSLASCSVVKHRIVAQMVKDGANPIDAYCAIQSGSQTGDATLCALRALGKTN